MDSGSDLDSGVRLPGFEFHSLSELSWTDYVTSLVLSFLTNKIEADNNTYFMWLL